jgi:hypothetical protein
MPTPSVDPTASPTASPRPERWSFCRHVSDVGDLRHAVLRGTKPPRALVEQAEALEARLTDPALDDLEGHRRRLRRAILDAGGEHLRLRGAGVGRGARARLDHGAGPARLRANARVRGPRLRAPSGSGDPEVGTREQPVAVVGERVDTRCTGLPCGS